MLSCGDERHIKVSNPTHTLHVCVEEEGQIGKLK